MDKHKRDRSGEPFQNNFTENEGAHPPAREEASHDLKPDEDLDPTQDEQPAR